MTIEEMKNVDGRTVDPETLVDIRTVKIVFCKPFLHNRGAVKCY